MGSDPARDCGVGEREQPQHPRLFHSGATVAQFATFVEPARVLRGSAFFNVESFLRCASRYRRYPDFRFGRTGFRVVVSPSTSGF